MIVRRNFCRGRVAQRGGIIFRMVFFLFLLIVSFVIYLEYEPLLRLAGSFWVVDEPPQKSDVIVMLSDDNLGADRATRAAELFKSGFAPVVMASGRYLRPYASIAELEQHDLTSRGVPASAVVPLTHYAENTREEAAAISKELGSRRWRRVIVVTSNYHTRRARYICERLFPAGTILHMVAARDSDYDPDSWWMSRLGLKLFFTEAVGLPVAMWELRGEPVETSSAAFDTEQSLRVSSYWPDTNWLPEGAGSGLHRRAPILYFIDSLRIACPPGPGVPN